VSGGSFGARRFPTNEEKHMTQTATLLQVADVQALLVPISAQLKVIHDQLTALQTATPPPVVTPPPATSFFNGAAVTDNPVADLVKVGPNSQFKNLSEGLAAVKAGGTVLIENGATFWEQGVFTRVPCTIKAVTAVKDGGKPWVLDCKGTRPGWGKGGILVRFDSTLQDGVIMNAHVSKDDGGNAGGVCTEATCDILNMIDMEIHDCDNGLRSIQGQVGNHWSLTRVNVHDCGQGGQSIGASGNTHNAYIIGVAGNSVLNAKDCKFTKSGEGHAFKARWTELNFDGCLFEPNTEGRCIDPCEGGTWNLNNCTLHKVSGSNQKQVAMYAAENVNHPGAGLKFTGCTFNMDTDGSISNTRDAMPATFVTGGTINGNLRFDGNVVRN